MSYKLHMQVFGDFIGIWKKASVLTALLAWVGAFPAGANTGETAACMTRSAQVLADFHELLDGHVEGALFSAELLGRRPGFNVAQFDHEFHQAFGDAAGQERFLDLFLREGIERPQELVYYVGPLEVRHLLGALSPNEFLKAISLFKKSGKLDYPTLASIIAKSGKTPEEQARNWEAEYQKRLAPKIVEPKPDENTFSREEVAHARSQLGDELFERALGFYNSPRHGYLKAMLAEVKELEFGKSLTEGALSESTIEIPEVLQRILSDLLEHQRTLGELQKSVSIERHQFGRKAYRDLLPHYSHVQDPINATLTDLTLQKFWRPGLTMNMGDPKQIVFRYTLRSSHSPPIHFEMDEATFIHTLLGHTWEHFSYEDFRQPNSIKKFEEMYNQGKALGMFPPHMNLEEILNHLRWGLMTLNAGDLDKMTENSNHHSRIFKFKMKTRGKNPGLYGVFLIPKSDLTWGVQFFPIITDGIGPFFSSLNEVRPQIKFLPNQQGRFEKGSSSDKVPEYIRALRVP